MPLDRSVVLLALTLLGAPLVVAVGEKLVATWETRNYGIELACQDGERVLERQFDDEARIVDLIERPTERQGGRRADMEDHVRAEYFTFADDVKMLGSDYEDETFIHRILRI